MLHKIYTHTTFSNTHVAVNFRKTQDKQASKRHTPKHRNTLTLTLSWRQIGITLSFYCCTTAHTLTHLLPHSFSFLPFFLSSFLPSALDYSTIFIFIKHSIDSSVVSSSLIKQSHWGTTRSTQCSQDAQDDSRSSRCVCIVFELFELAAAAASRTFPFLSSQTPWRVESGSGGN